MKVVLFCGSQGLRMRDVSNPDVFNCIPKPLAPIGDRPLLLHVMKYYAYLGHTDFVLCLGYGARTIKEYFLNYREALLNDFVLSGGGSDGGAEVELLGRDLQDWRITFVDTGLHTNVGQRLRAVRQYVEQDEVFLADYADGLTDLPLPHMLDRFHEQRKIASLLCLWRSAGWCLAPAASGPLRPRRARRRFCGISQTRR